MGQLEVLYRNLDEKQEEIERISEEISEIRKNSKDETEIENLCKRVERLVKEKNLIQNFIEDKQRSNNELYQEGVEDGKKIKEEQASRMSVEKNEAPSIEFEEEKESTQKSKRKAELDFLKDTDLIFRQREKQEKLKLRDKCQRSINNIDQKLSKIRRSRTMFTGKILQKLKKDRKNLIAILKEIDSPKKINISEYERKINNIDKKSVELVEKANVIKKTINYAKVATVVGVGCVLFATGVNTIKNNSENNRNEERTQNLLVLEDEDLEEALNITPENIAILYDLNQTYLEFKEDVDKKEKIDRGELIEFSKEIEGKQIEIIKDKLVAEYVEEKEKNGENINPDDVNIELRCVSNQDGDNSFAIIDGERYEVDDILEDAINETGNNQDTIRHFDEHSDEKIVKAQEEYIRSLLKAASKGVEMKDVWGKGLQFSTVEVTKESIKKEKFENLNEMLEKFEKNPNENLQKHIMELAEELGIKKENISEKSESENEPEF